MLLMYGEILSVCENTDFLNVFTNLISTDNKAPEMLCYADIS